MTGGTSGRSRELFAAIAAAVLLASAFIAVSSEEDFDAWLKYVAEHSDPVSDEAVQEISTKFLSKQTFYSQSDKTLTGFDAWLAEKKLLGDNSKAQAQPTDQQRHGGNSKLEQTIYVAKDGSGDFYTIAGALNSIPVYNSARKTIFIKAGVYEEKIVIPSSQQYITFIGEGPDKTVITGHATAGDQYGDELLKTYRSATVGVNSDHFIAKDIRFENTSPQPEPGAVGKQAVALRISGDKAAFYNVAVLGAQDTLYVHQGRHVFLNSYIQGSIDFIFGNGRSYFKDSHIYSIASSFGSITAQKRNESDMNTGFSFVNCQIDGTGIIYLGRAWGNYSRVIYSWSYLNSMILPEGWQDWGVPARQQTVYYAQYECNGPGADTSKRVPYAKNLNYEEAKPFLTDAFVNGHSWLTPEEDVHP
ncbi:hypothetical protein R1sor_027491 [Riccia sorocarpa]|uniref:Pectinesterase n=1 Tax=Riccia sorocarpa TaxID=122646 RepID=A0ABD3GF41_9MARC